MTEAEWLEQVATRSREPPGGWTSPRKCRLWSCAMCRRLWPILADERSQRAVDVAERFADGLATEEELNVAHAAAKAVRDRLAPTPHARHDALWVQEECASAVEQLADPYFCECAESIASAAVGAWRRFAALNDPKRNASDDGYYGSAAEEAQEAADRAHLALFRDIIGNPYRPTPFSPSWRTSTAVALASQMYESRGFGAMPILGDALQDAGCDSADVLDHCRGEGPHVRGCWVVDLVLGKE